MGKEDKSKRGDQVDDDEDDDDETEDDDQNTDDDEDDDDDGDATGKKGESSKSGEKTFTQAEVDALIKRRLNRATRKIRGELRTELESEIKDKGGDEDTQAKIKEANDRLERLEDLEELAEERYEQELDDLPEAIRDLAPDDDEDIIVKERWMVTKARPAAKKMLADAEGDGKRKTEKKEGDTDRRRARRGNEAKDPPARPKKADRGEAFTKLKDEAKGSGAYRRML